ncbi:hypothetical protein DFQ28_002846 [Apophysomyces sp. BC1034]|nr:hypothetical protein DFQ29_002131 [Apophysomyces sp. BC1021]KAG0189835.1 hypothetical protein DFQ28_002846 [Apophysomyces sp. BC1034]
MSELLNKVYNSREVLKAEAQEFARLKGFAVTTGTSNATRLWLQCRCGGSFRNNKELTLKMPKIRWDTLRTRCSFVIKPVIKSVKINYNWTLTGAVDELNHDLATTPIIFHQHRDIIEIVKQVIAAHAKPKMISETFRGLDGQLTIFPKDIDNMRTRLFSQRNDQFEIADYRHHRECEIRYFHNSERRVQGLFSVMTFF